MDQGQIKQVLLNLYVNAWQAMPNGGEISISTVNVKLKKRDVADLGIEPGYFIKLSVTDNGVGMDEEVQRRIFEPFFTTKERGRGTGLGLASAYGIINNHRGAVKVTSRVDYGTTFIIFLPTTSEEAETETVRVTPLRNGKETILVVDDEKNIVEVTDEMLQTMGYNVLTALSGEEALDIFSNSHHEIDLVILDMIMPGLSGSETFGHIKDIRKDAKVLLSSGYSLKGDAKKIMARGCNGFIQKPYNLEKLSEVLNVILDGKSIDSQMQPLKAAL
ncbi:MAG: response regulator [Deltaproteobacteria bacterium]|nr:response regulator [Deltaproteobacteria bacterium]